MNSGLRIELPGQSGSSIRRKKAGIVYPSFSSSQFMRGGIQLQKRQLLKWQIRREQLLCGNVRITEKQEVIGLFERPDRKGVAGVRLNEVATLGERPVQNRRKRDA